MRFFYFYRGSMSKLTAAQRKKLDDSDFGWPERKLYPIMDQSDVDAAATLVGKAPDSEQAKIKRRIIAICKRKGLKPPAAWVEKGAKMTATFALGDTEFISGDMVIRRGKVFEAGDYEDKEFDITPEEMLAAVAEFEPVPLDVEHRPSIFDGKLGELRSVELAENGWDLVGEIAIPRWLHEVIGDAPVKVSTQWDKVAKRLDRLALVIDPRVTDAAMMSGYVGFAGSRHSSADMADIQTIHDLTAKQGAKCALPNVKYSKTGESMDKMDKATFLEKMWAFFTGEGAVPVTPTTPDPAVTPKPPTVDPEKEAMRAELERMKLERIAKDAAAFAEAEIAASRAYPAERDALVVAFSQAAQDDAKHGAVTFAGGAQGSRVDGLKAMYAARPAHGLTTERLQPGQAQGAVVLSNQQTTADPSAPKPLTQEQLEKYLAMTPVGQAALKARQNGGS